MNFVETLQSLENGQVMAEVGEAWRDLLEQIAAHQALIGKGAAKGKLVLALEVSAESGLATVAASVDGKAPKAPRGRTLFWLAPGGTMSRQNPNQHELFKAVKTEGE